MVKIENCPRCKKRINVDINADNLMFVCPKCKVYVANPKINKQKEEKMPTKKKEETSETVEDTKEKKSKTEIKEEHAEAVIALLKQRNVSQEEATKVLSCAYNKAKKAY